ncbi:MAG: hypothetical protein GX934_11730 [Burkholderiales bacterium]|nr:hypothetical protein [Burkholderiales bacterium]
MTKTPPMPRLQVSVLLRDEHGKSYHVPGRTCRGLAIHQPHSLIRGTAYPVPQPRNDQRWTITHEESGFAIGCVRGGIRAAWAALCRLANAADWTRPQSEVCRDPECRRLWRLIPVVGAPRAEEVLP